MNNQFGVDYDFPGLCALCHTEICEFNGSNSLGYPNITSLKGNYHQMIVLLDDNSKMQVSLCTDCYFGLKPDDMKPLMESVINGWQKQVDKLDWSEDKKLDHMTEYSKKHITNRADFPYSLQDSIKIKKPDTKKLDVKVRKEG